MTSVDPSGLDLLRDLVEAARRWKEFEEEARLKQRLWGNPWEEKPCNERNRGALRYAFAGRAWGQWRLKALNYVMPGESPEPSDQVQKALRGFIEQAVLGYFAPRAVAASPTSQLAVAMSLTFSELSFQMERDITETYDLCLCVCETSTGRYKWEELQKAATTRRSKELSEWIQTPTASEDLGGFGGGSAGIGARDIPTLVQKLLRKYGGEGGKLAPKQAQTFADPCGQLSK